MMMMMMLMQNAGCRTLSRSTACELCRRASGWSWYAVRRAVLGPCSTGTVMDDVSRAPTITTSSLHIIPGIWNFRAAYARVRRHLHYCFVAADCKYRSTRDRRSLARLLQFTSNRRRIFSRTWTAALGHFYLPVPHPFSSRRRMER